MPFSALNGAQAKVRRRRWHPTPVLLPGKSHGWRSLVGCSLWGRWESDMTERLHFHFSPSCIGEGNGNPLQCSCLENPRDGGAWWAAVYGVAQSRTRSDLAAAAAAGQGVLLKSPSRDRRPMRNLHFTSHLLIHREEGPWLTPALDAALFTEARAVSQS